MSLKLTWIKPPHDKVKLYKLALREAIALLVLNGIYETEISARNSIMKKAKQNYE